MAAATAAETSAKMLLSLTVIQLSGWNIKWAKTSLHTTVVLSRICYGYRENALLHTARKTKTD